MKHVLAGMVALLFFGSQLLAQPATQPAGRGGAARGAGARGGARGPNMDAFYKLGPDSMKQEGVPHGRWVGPTTLPTAAFPGNQHTYFVYIPAQYDPKIPTPVMVFNDGQAMMADPGDVQAANVLDNLIWRREIPVMIGVFINPARLPTEPEPNPGNWGDRTTRRGDEYNPPTDLYAKVICDELMPAIRKDYNISPDPNLHGIMGSSSGGCAAFGVAWFRPNEFRKVITFVGSFTDIRGEYIYPELVAQSEKKPIRIFMQDGRNDNRRTPETLKNDWFYQNVRLKDALEKKGYEVNYVWGIGQHGQKQGGAIFPEMMRWLWRDQPVDPDPTNATERAFRGPATAPAP